jgi:hypothetical protein
MTVIGAVESTASREVLADPRIHKVALGTTTSSSNPKGQPGAYLLSNATTYYMGHAYAVVPNSGAPYLTPIAPWASGAQVDQHTYDTVILEDWANFDGVDFIVGDGSTTFAHGVTVACWFLNSANSAVTLDHIGTTCYFENGEVVSHLQTQNANQYAPVAGIVLEIDANYGVLVDMTQAL